jgi:hypothetical protein
MAWRVRDPGEEVFDAALRGEWRLVQPDSLRVLSGFGEDIAVELRLGGGDAQAVVAVGVGDERSGDEAESNLASFDAIAFLQQAGVLVAVAGREAVGEEGDVSTGEVEANDKRASEGGR